MSNFDISKLTMGELKTIEKMSGQSFNDLADDSKPKGELFTAVAYIAKRRTDPSFTPNQAEALTLEEVTEIIAGSEATEEDADPKA